MWCASGTDFLDVLCGTSTINMTLSWWEIVGIELKVSGVYHLSISLSLYIYIYIYSPLRYYEKNLMWKRNISFNDTWEQYFFRHLKWGVKISLWLWVWAWKYRRDVSVFPLTKISWCWKYLFTFVTDTSPLQFKTLQLNISTSWVYFEDKIHPGMGLYISLYLYDINSSTPGRCRDHSKSLPFKLRVNFRVDILRNSYGIALGRMTKNPFGDTSTLVQAMSWCATFSALLTLCVGNSPVIGEFPAHKPVTRSFDVFFDLRLNKRLSKQSWDWWFETPLRSLWRHCNGWQAVWLKPCNITMTS